MASERVKTNRARLILVVSGVVWLAVVTSVAGWW